MTAVDEHRRLEVAEYGPVIAERRGADTWASGLCYYYLTTLVVVIAALFAHDFVPLCTRHPGSATRVDALSGWAAWDGEWYVRIATGGYSYDPQRMSSVAFFPLYPALAAPLIHGLGMRPEAALLVVSHGALIGVFVLMAAYVRRRFAAEPALGEYVLLALGLFPTAFYFRMTYTESIFLLVTLLAMYGMLRDWRPFWIAAAIGLATASRTVGVALIPVFWLYLWQEMAGARPEDSGRLKQLAPWSLRAGALLPLCCWGLIAYIVFQWMAFGEPLAFVQTQVHWSERSLELGDRVIGTLTLEPIRAVYDPSSNCYWGRVPPVDNLLFNMKAANPLYFLATVALVAWGVCKRWLDVREAVLAAGLLLIPYALQGARTGMSSQARYAAVVFPMYLVLGHVLHRLPTAVGAGLVALSGLLMAVYTALFVNWYWFY